MHRAGKPPQSLDRSLVDALLKSTDRPGSNTELIETHISWLILSGDYAYKIKKPVVLDFLDFGNLERRRHFCEEEVRLNRPWARQIYLGVVPVTEHRGEVRFGGQGKIVEYAVRMRRFDDRLRLDMQLANELLCVADMQQLAANIARRHMQAPVVRPDQRDRVLAVTRSFMLDNFGALEGTIETGMLASLRNWTERELDRCAALIAQRFDAGFVRDCHGDLHLGNLVRLEDGITTFDCIEFNADLRQIDVICDIAFLLMDLVVKERKDLATHFLNAYLEATGDYGGVALLRMFFVYRCLVRAKVDVIRSAARNDHAERNADIERALSYCRLAEAEIAATRPVLIVMHGLSGSGKTWVSEQLMVALPAIRVRSDIERRQIFSLAPGDSSHSAPGQGLYTSAANDEVYERLFAVARLLLGAGHDVILDAAFLERAGRDAAFRIARRCSCPALVVAVEASRTVMQERILGRSAQKREPSEANLAVLDFQLDSAEWLNTDEFDHAVTFVNDGTNDARVFCDKIVSWARRHTGREAPGPVRK